MPQDFSGNIVKGLNCGVCVYVWWCADVQHNFLCVCACASVIKA